MKRMISISRFFSPAMISFWSELLEKILEDCVFVRNIWQTMFLLEISMKDAIIATVINNDKVCEVFLKAVALNQVFRLKNQVLRP